MARTVDLAELLTSHGDALLARLHVGDVGRVVSYDHEAQTADVELVIREPLVNEDGTVEHEDLPVLADVPIAWLGGGGFHVHLPLAEGDHVLLVFTDKATGSWRATGKTTEPGDLRRHHLSYCFAIPCVRPDSAPITGTSATQATVVAPDGGTFTVSKSGADAQFVALANLVQQGFDALQTAFDGHTHVVNTTGTAAAQAGTAAAVVSPVGPLGPVASATLKSD